MKRKVITIEVTDEEVDALEDIFFVKLSEERREKLQDVKHSLWKKIATAFDYDDEEAENLNQNHTPLQRSDETGDKNE